MVLLEGRKEDSYKKFQKSIDAERNMVSNYMDNASAYDFLLDEPFMKETNYKYLNDILEHYYTVNYYSGEDEPLPTVPARDVLFRFRSEIDKIVTSLDTFEKHKSKFKYPEFRKYSTNIEDFFKEAQKIKTDVETKQIEKSARKEVEKIYDSDTVLIVKPKTHTASCYYGAGTKWCTTMKGNTSYFDNHTKNANLYYIIVKKKNVSDRFYKIAINIKPGQKLIDSEWYDVQDNMLGYGEKDLFLTIIPQKAVDSIYDDLKQLKDSWFTKELVPTIPKTALMQASSKLYLSSTKSVNIALRFEQFELHDDLGDVEEDGEFQRFSAKYRLSEFNQTEMELVDPDVDSHFYEDGSVYGVVLEGENTYQIILNFEQDDDYGNDYLLNYGKQLQTDGNFNKDTSFPVSMHKMLDKTLDKITSYDYFKAKLSEFSEKKGINRKYTFAGYTFTKGGKLTRALINYIDSLPEGGIGNKLDFLKRTGQVTVTPEGSFSKTGRQISLQGYLSSFFSAANQAGIIQKPKGKNGYIKGPNFDKYKEKFS